MDKHHFNLRPSTRCPSLLVENISPKISTIPRTSYGRQKREMKKMSKESSIFVSFMKRHSCLFKKENELYTLGVAEIAIIVLLSGKKVFSPGNPLMDVLLDRLLSKKVVTGNTLNPKPNPNPGMDELLEAQCNLKVHDLNLQFTNLVNQLELENKMGDEFCKMRKESAERCWWEGLKHALYVYQLDQVNVALEELKKNVVRRYEKMRSDGKGASRTPYFMGVGPKGGQEIIVFPPTVSQRGQTFPTQAPQDLNAFDLGLSLTPYGYSMGYNCGRHFW